MSHISIRRNRSRWAGVGAMAAAVLVASSAVVLVGAAAPADARPSARAQPESSADIDSADGRFLDISITEVTPSTVTTTTPSTVTVSGTVDNVGDRAVDDVAVRLQRAPAVTAPEGIRTALTLDQNLYDTVGTFETVATSIDIGASVPFTLTMPLRSATGPSLNVTRPGVYPLLVNVNGAPDYGEQARLDAKRFLLPVTGVPRDPTVADPASPTAGAVAPDISDPVAVTMMWPLADRPAIAAGQAGTVDGRIRLVDDDLATSLAPGGRLDGLVSALEFAVDDQVDPGDALANSTCVAIDPDLLVTVSNMTRGYLVLDDPRDPAGPASDGTGASAASAWLERVRTLAADLCVTALPFAQTDLAAVARIANPALTASALVAPSDVIDALLGVTSQRGFVWPDSGVMDDRTAETVRGTGDSVALLASNAVAGDGRSDFVRAAGPTATGNTLEVATFDPVTSTALSAVGDEVQTPTFTPRSQVFDVERDSRTARIQDALGAVNYLAVTPTPGRQRSLAVVPPQMWTADAAEATAVSSTVSALLRSGLATPRPLSVWLAGDPGPVATTLAYPTSALADSTPPSTVEVASDEAARVDRFMAALTDDPQNPLSPQLYTNPIREDLLRAMTTNGLRSSRRADADVSAAERLEDTRRGLDATLGSVTVLAPGGVFTLASEQSPLLLVARNDLPIGITVSLAVDAPEQMRIDDIGPQVLPPRGSRSLQVPTEVTDSAKLVVQFGLTTTDGLVLGEATSVTVRSNAYGQALAFITAGAAALLLLLAGRRLWHRFRGQPDPADEG